MKKYKDGKAKRSCHKMETVIESIRVEFLGLVRKNNSGYFISLQKVYEYLENPEVAEKYLLEESSRRNFRKRFLRNEKYLLSEAQNEDDLGKEYIMRKIDNISFPWFSTEGFKLFCMVSNETKSHFVRKYFIQIERDYLRALEQSDEENTSEITNLKRSIEKSDSLLLKLNDRCDEYLEETLMLRQKLRSTERLAVILEDNEDFATVGNPEYKMYLYIMESYMKKVPLYIVNADYAVSKPLVKKIIPNKTTNKTANKTTNKTKKSEEFKFPDSSDDELVDSQVVESGGLQQPMNHYNDELLNYEYDQFNFMRDIKRDHNSGEDSPTLYYYIAGWTEKKEKKSDNYYKIADLYVKDKEHLASIKDMLDDESHLIDNKYIYKTARKWIYKTDYNTINTICLTSMNDRFLEQLRLE